ncbi:uncharacterized protein KY384_000119 [Bacidia gigantensis]|uniref:uncharacterized protein n=1 Tax=Bacidia gigantensis TaxID=2732470 RepID=UPI001D04AE83|nr:uncharacterized protein KY384_000119 [Bacidia gigantensis]KAG8526126.1 hypothetical protein KY384_000119 [Bacidia gigantensis]
MQQFYRRPSREALIPAIGVEQNGPHLWWTMVFGADGELVTNRTVLAMLETSVRDERSTDSKAWNTPRTRNLTMPVTQGLEYIMEDGMIKNDIWLELNATAAIPFWASMAPVPEAENNLTSRRYDYPILSRFIESLSAAIATAEKAEDIAASVAKTYDHALLSRTVGILESRSPTESFQRKTIQVTRIPRAPFIALIVLDTIYATIATILMISAVIAVRYGEGVNDAQARLCTQAIVAESFESPALGDDAKSADDLFAERRGLPTRRIAIVKRKGGGRKYKQIVMPESVRKASPVVQSDRIQVAKSKFSTTYSSTPPYERVSLHEDRFGRRMQKAQKTKRSRFKGGTIS